MKTTIKVQNLKCGGCVNTIKSGLQKLPAIDNIFIDVEKSIINFSYQEEKDVLQVKAKLAKLGYPTQEEKNSIWTKSKSYLSCATGKINN